VANTRISSSIKLAALGAFAFAAQVACSDDPPQNPIIPPGNTSGSANNTAGTPSTGGTFGTAGTPSNTSGTGFGTAGTPATGGAGGAGGTGTAGTGTAGTGTAGTGGTGIVPNEPFCKDKPLEPLPYTVTSGFKQAGWSPTAVMQIKAGAQITPDPPDNCTMRLPGAVGDCSVWRYTPDPAGASPAWVEWILQWDAGYAHDPVCVAEGATKLIFHAKSKTDGEKVVFGGAGAEELEATLTPEWKRYEITLGTYNSFESGVKTGFSFKVVPAAENPTVVEFYVDNIMIVKDLPPDPAGGGEGGGGGGGAE
jgi:hypothetical protein